MNVYCTRLCYNKKGGKSGIEKDLREIFKLYQIQTKGYTNSPSTQGRKRGGPSIKKNGRKKSTQTAQTEKESTDCHRKRKSRTGLGNHLTDNQAPKPVHPDRSTKKGKFEF